MKWFHQVTKASCHVFMFWGTGFASIYDLTIGFWKCSVSVVFFDFHFTRYKFCIQVSIQENLNSSLCIHDARNFDEYTQVLARDTTNKMAFLGGDEGAVLCIALLCTIVWWRKLSSKKRSTWARKWLRRRRWDVFPSEVY